jgi:AcrR family transcriptional regulator
MNVNRRTQAERSAATRAALIAAARPLFAAHGFNAVGTETIVREAGVTRGALYHQFEDKTELFAAVFEAVEEEITEGIGRAVVAAAPEDAMGALQIGADAWLDACEDPEVQRIVLLEAPAVLGWARWREGGLRHGMGLVTGVLEHAVATGQIPSQPVAPLAHLIIGAIDEAAMYVAQADDAATAREEVREVTRRFISALTSAR